MKRFIIVCEAEADFRAARILTDRLVYQEVEWLRDQDLDHFRKWVGLDDAESFITWSGIRDAVRAKRLRLPRVYGKFDGKPGAPDAHAARFVLLVSNALAETPDGVILLRDADHQDTRRTGLSQARDEFQQRSPIAVAIGVADRKREAWILAMLVSSRADETAQLTEIERELGFNPTREPQRLRGHDNGPRDAKTVLRRLIGDDFVREDDCLRTGPLPRRDSTVSSNLTWACTSSSRSRRPASCRCSGTDSACAPSSRPTREFS